MKYSESYLRPFVLPTGINVGWHVWLYVRVFMGKFLSNEVT